MRKMFSRCPIRSLTFMAALAVSLLTLMTCLPATALAVEKMKAEEVVAKHLESIGSAAARSAARSRVVVGNTRATFRARNSSGAIEGRAVFGSVNHKIMFGMGFTAPNYPGEKFGFDGKRFTIGYLTPGVRSTLGNFLLIHSDVFREGLMGGTLTSAWPLLDIAERAAKLEYAGTDKIADLPVHKLEYSPKKSSELRITLYFDAKTFEHVRTEYSRVVAPRLGAGGIDNQARQMETRYKMIENFSAYRKEGELNLPHSYTLQLEITKTNGSSSDKWETEFSQFVFNQEIDDAGFNVEGN
jgi:outer membrane lipoprotein-sorting protein